MLVVGDVLAVAGTDVNAHLRLRAATLASGGVVSHGSAAGLWGLPVPISNDLVHVTVTVPTHRPIAGLCVHRRPLGPGDRSRVNEVDATSRRRTVLDCLLTWPDDRAADLLDHVLRCRMFTIDSLEQLAASASGDHGIVRLRQMLAASSAGSWSAAERKLHDLLRGARIRGWCANAAVSLLDGRTALIDVWFPAERVAIEVDGQAWHTDRTRFERDRARQNALILAGATVLRFTWTDITAAPERVVREVTSAVLSRRQG
jgi:very-short-patch-repair endonuclease